MSLMNQNPPGNNFRNLWDQAVLRFEEQLVKNPDDIDALIGLADSLVTLWCFGFLSRKESLPRAKEAVNSALSLSNNNDEVLILNGILKLADWNWNAAEKEFLHAIELNPNNPKSHHWLALYLAAMGRRKQAVFESKRALELDPSPSYKTGYGAILYFAHDFLQMAEVMEEVIRENPAFPPGYDWLGMAYIQLGKYENSIKIYKKALDLADGAAEVMAGLGHAYAIAGKVKEACALLDDLTLLSEKWYVPPVQIAYVHIGLGEFDRAFQLLNVAFAERSWELVFIREEPWLDILHLDDRFLDLLERIKFPGKQGSI